MHLLDGATGLWADGHADPARQPEPANAAAMSYASRRGPTLKDSIDGKPATEEEAMHPAIIQAVAAEQSRDLRADAAARRQARQIRRSQRAGRPRGSRPLIRIPLRSPRAV